MRTVNETAMIEARVASERADAAQREWERNDRMRRVAADAIESCAREAQSGGLVDLAQRLAGIVDLLRGEWLQSPQAMNTQRGGQ